MVPPRVGTQEVPRVEGLRGSILRAGTLSPRQRRPVPRSLQAPL